MYKPEKIDVKEQALSWIYQTISMPLNGKGLSQDKENSIAETISQVDLAYVDCSANDDGVNKLKASVRILDRYFSARRFYNMVPRDSGVWPLSEPFAINMIRSIFIPRNGKNLTINDMQATLKEAVDQSSAAIRTTISECEERRREDLKLLRQIQGNSGSK